MSDTRPPMTAGPMERALKFLNKTSLNCAEVAVGVGVAAAGNGVAVVAGEAGGELGACGCGVEVAGCSGSCWAVTISTSAADVAKARINRAIMTGLPVIMTIC